MDAGKGLPGEPTRYRWKPLARLRFGNRVVTVNVKFVSGFMAEGCSKLAAAEAGTLFSHLSRWQASNLTNFSQDALWFPAHFTFKLVKVKVGVDIISEVSTCT